MRPVDPLGALLGAPQEARLRSRFGLHGVELRLITSGWHRLVVAAPERVFVFPRDQSEVPGLVREADVLTSVQLGAAPRCFGLHQDDGVSPHPFLELSRIPGRSYDMLMGELTADQTATVLEQLAVHAARWHAVPVPPRFRSAPDHRCPPDVRGPWVHPDKAPAAVSWAAELLAAHSLRSRTDLWVRAVAEVAAMDEVTLHGELSEGQFLLDERLRLTGVVDWDGLHVGHPLVDLKFGVGGQSLHRTDPLLKRRMWEAYARERNMPLPAWQAVDLFCCLIDATVLVRDHPHDNRVGQALLDLEAATAAVAKAGHPFC